jgi:uncharacterized protein YjiS (DUF1127 family)
MTSMISMTLPAPLARLFGWFTRQAKFHETRLALNGLDRRALRDIGLDASEIASVSAEASGITERQRTRFVPYY